VTDSAAADLPAEIDTTKPHPARMYDYYLGGKNHFAADRETAQKMLAAASHARTGARENRAFLGRAVRYLAGEAGIPPGVVLVSEWRPSGTGPRPTPAEVNVFGGVARKP
jgi:hypothetical protein